MILLKDGKLQTIRVWHSDINYEGGIDMHFFAIMKEKMKMLFMTHYRR